MMRTLLAALCSMCVFAVHAQGTAKWADPAKVLRVAIPIAETGFDPQAAQDLYSATIMSAIFDPLYEYDYLARPNRIVPRTAEALPEISADGLTWKIRIRKGIYFANDPAFKGVKRELTAHDYVYSLKRLVDPKMRSPNVFILRGKLAGLSEAVAKAGAKLDYNAENQSQRREHPVEPPDDHETSRNFGIELQNINAELGRRLQLKETRGALVTDVDSDGPAYAAGLARNDVIIQVGGQSVADKTEAKRELDKIPVGGTVTVRVMRRGENGSRRRFMTMVKE